MNGLEPISILMAVDEVYSNGNSDPHYLEILANFQSNPENIPKCQEILNDIESSDACRFFASNTLCKIAQNFLPNWNISLALQLSQWSINYLLELSSNFDRNVFINLSKLNAIILHYFWDSNHEECMEEWGSIIELFDNSPNQWSVGLFLLDSLHDTFLTSTNPKIIEIFSKKCLSTIFSLSFSVAKKMKNTTLPQYRYILEMSLNLINKCILDRNENMNDSPKSPYCALITYDFNDLLMEDHLIEFFFEIFEIFTIPAALKCILSITETADTFDQPLRTRKNKPFHTTQSYNCNELRNLNETPITVMINQICNCVLHVIQSKIGLNDEFTINTLSLILSNIATRMNFFTIQQIKEFKRFIQVLVYFTIYMLESNNHSFENVFHLIQFWSKLEIALRNDGPNVEPKRILANISPQICFSYISSLLNMVTIPGSDTDNAIINFMEAKICQYIFPIQNFIMMNPNLICQQIFTGLLNKQKELEDNINNLQQETFSEEVFQIGALERQLCVFMQIASCVVLIKTSGVQNDPNIKYHPSFFSFMVNLMKCSVDWASKGFLFPRIEMCILLFISQFKNTLFGCASLKTQLSRQLFQQLKNKRSLSSFTECQTFFFDRLIVTLKYFSKFYILLNTTLSILYNDNKILPSSESFANLLDETIRNNLPFMNELKFISLRSKFFSILVKIIFQNHKVDNSYLITILQFLHSRYQKEMQLEEICFLAIDICGIFNEAKDNITYNLMFDWFIAGHSEIFVNFLFDKCGEISHSSICSEYQIIFMNSILKMWKSIVLCIPPKRVIFHSSSRNGLLLFKMATNVTNSYLSYILTIINNKQSNESPNEEANEPNDVNINYPQNESIHDIDSNGLNHHHYKGIKYSFVILRNLVSGGYVPFGAFKIYNDLVFENTLKILTDTFKALHIETIIQYPSVLSSVIHLFRDLVFYHFEILFSIDFNLIDTILLYTEKCLLQPHEEIQNMAIDIVANILQNSIDRLHGQNPIQDYFSDFSTIFFILWQIILHDTSKINSNIVFSIKTMIFLKISSIELVKEKIYEKIFEQKRVLLNKLFDELSVKLNSKNSHDIILQLQSILTFLQQFTSFSFV